MRVARASRARVRGRRGAPPQAAPADIEDACKLGARHAGCPYYAARMALPYAEARLRGDAACVLGCDPPVGVVVRA
jgi:hypothetical protein